MPSRIQVYAILVVAAAAWAGPLWFAGVPITMQHAAPFGFTAGALIAVLRLFDKFLWRLPGINQYLAKRPILHGTWKANLVSTWKDPKTGKQAAPFDGYMVFTQTYSALSVRLFTRSARSHSMVAGFYEKSAGTLELATAYQNNPSIDLRQEKSAIHFGSLLAELSGNPCIGMTGEYWTSRNTSGKIELSDHRPILVTSYTDGALHYGTSPPKRVRKWYFLWLA